MKKEKKRDNNTLTHIQELPLQKWKERERRKKKGGGSWEEKETTVFTVHNH